MPRRFYRKKRNKPDRIKIIAGSHKIGDSIDDKIITGFGKEWNENGDTVQYAYFTPKEENKIIHTTFSSGESVYRNANGVCEDAPCCGCCSF